MKRVFALLVCLLAVLNTQVVHGQEPTPAPSEEPGRDVRIVNGQPSMSFATFERVLRAARSPALGEAQAMYDAIVQFGIEPSFFAAVFNYKSRFGSDPAWPGRKPDGTYTQNPGDLACGADSTWECYTLPDSTLSYRSYPTWEVGTRDWAAIIENYYFGQGWTTVEEIIPEYAPEYDGNDPADFIRRVLTDMAAWDGTDAPVPSPSAVGVDPSKITADYWVEGPMDGGFYRIMRTLASISWFFNRSLFMGHESLGQFHTSFVDGFAGVLDVVGTSVNPTLRIIGILSLTLAALALVLTPIFRQYIVSTRRAALAVVFVPVVMAAAGGGFVAIEESRSWFADTTSRAASGRAGIMFSYDNPPTPGTGTMGAIQPYYGADQSTLGVQDIAAAYMLANREIVYGDADLPPDFDRLYFTADEYFATSDYPSWPETPKEERSRLNALAQRGLTRALMGFSVSIPAVLDRVLTLLFTLNVGIVALNVLLIVPFIVLDTYAGLALELLKQIPKLLVSSALLTLLQVIATVFMLIVARSGNIYVVAITGAVDALALAVAVVLVAFIAVRAMFAFVSAAVSGGVGMAHDVGRVVAGGAALAVGSAIAGGRTAHRAGSRVAHAADDAVTGAVDKAVGAGKGVAKTVGAMAAAKAAGASGDYSFFYGMGATKTGRAIAQAGLSVGAFGDDANTLNPGDALAGLTASVVRGDREPTSLRSLILMRNDLKNRQARAASPGTRVGQRQATNGRAPHTPHQQPAAAQAASNGSGASAGSAASHSSPPISRAVAPAAPAQPQADDAPPPGPGASYVPPAGVGTATPPAAPRGARVYQTPPAAAQPAARSIADQQNAAARRAYADYLMNGGQPKRWEHLSLGEQSSIQAAVRDKQRARMPRHAPQPPKDQQ